MRHLLLFDETESVPLGMEQSPEREARYGRMTYTPPTDDGRACRTVFHFSVFASSWIHSSPRLLTRHRTPVKDCVRRGAMRE